MFATWIKTTFALRMSELNAINPFVNDTFLFHWHVGWGDENVGSFLVGS